MVKKNRILIVVGFFFSSVLFSCQRCGKYEIVDSREDHNGNVIYTVYSPDTCWDEMELFAQDLVINKGKYSAVGFFNPKSKTPQIREDFSMKPEYAFYLLANYTFNKEEDQSILHITDYRRKDMSFN